MITSEQEFRNEEGKRDEKTHNIAFGRKISPGRSGGLDKEPDLSFKGFLEN